MPLGSWFWSISDLSLLGNYFMVENRSSRRKENLFTPVSLGAKYVNKSHNVLIEGTKKSVRIIVWCLGSATLPCDTQAELRPTEASPGLFKGPKSIWSWHSILKFCSYCDPRGFRLGILGISCLVAFRLISSEVFTGVNTWLICTMLQYQLCYFMSRDFLFLQSLQTNQLKVQILICRGMSQSWKLQMFGINLDF